MASGGPSVKSAARGAGGGSARSRGAALHIHSLPDACLGRVFELVGHAWDNG